MQSSADDEEPGCGKSSERDEDSKAQFVLRSMVASLLSCIAAYERQAPVMTPEDIASRQVPGAWTILVRKQGSDEIKHFETQLDPDLAELRSNPLVVADRAYIEDITRSARLIGFAQETVWGQPYVMLVQQRRLELGNIKNGQLFRVSGYGAKGRIELSLANGMGDPAVGSRISEELVLRGELFPGRRSEYVIEGSPIWMKGTSVCRKYDFVGWKWAYGMTWRNFQLPFVDLSGGNHHTLFTLSAASASIGRRSPGHVWVGIYRFPRKASELLGGHRVRGTQFGFYPLEDGIDVLTDTEGAIRDEFEHLGRSPFEGVYRTLAFSLDEFQAKRLQDGLQQLREEYSTRSYNLFSCNCIHFARDVFALVVPSVSEVGRAETPTGWMDETLPEVYSFLANRLASPRLE